MPAPSKTGPDRIVEAALELLEQTGVDGVTMQAVAQRVGVRAPSLYKHVRDRSDLLRAVVDATMTELTRRMEAVSEPSPATALRAQLEALRQFARDRPHGFAVAVGGAPGVPAPAPEQLAASVRPVLAATTALVGERYALDGARLVVAWATGFLTMERAGAFRMGGDVDEAWTWGVDRIVDALGAQKGGSSG